MTIDGQMMCLPTEESELHFIRSVNQNNISTWEQFEYLLSIIVENRLVRIFQAHLDAQKQRELKEKKNL